MATHTALQTNAQVVRRSENHPEYVLLKLEATDHYVIAVVDRPQRLTITILVDGYVRMPEDDFRFPGAFCEWYMVRGDGNDLADQFEAHAADLAEELISLVAEAASEGLLI